MKFSEFSLEIDPSLTIERYTIKFVSENGKVTVTLRPFDLLSPTETKEISATDFEQIVDMISNINFTKVFLENCDKEGEDGTTIKLVINGNMYSCNAEISVWAPHRTKEPTETNKLLDLIEKICDVWPIYNDRKLLGF